jgi:NTP pyrophosphatase (non-canonical NTP hydrolase)
MDINELAADTWAWVDLMQWHNKTPLECLALITSEVGEAVQECRGINPTEKLPEELADIVLRTLDLMYELDYNIEYEIFSKMEKNKRKGTRGRLK